MTFSPIPYKYYFVTLIVQNPEIFIFNINSLLLLLEMIDHFQTTRYKYIINVIYLLFNSQRRLFGPDTSIKYVPVIFFTIYL